MPWPCRACSRSGGIAHNADYLVGQLYGGADEKEQLRRSQFRGDYEELAAHYRSMSTAGKLPLPATGALELMEANLHRMASIRVEVKRSLLATTLMVAGSIVLLPFTPGLWSCQGWLHLAIVLDLYARRIVGWAMGPSLDQSLAVDALVMALTHRRPPAGLIFHSDRGGPYLSLRVQQLATQWRLVLSTSRPGRCLDNAVAESFFHTLKTELVYQHRNPTREAARLAIFDYIAAFYNRTRRHSTNGFRLPEDQETQYAVSRT